MPIDWKIKTQQELEQSGQTPICNKMINQRGAELVEMLKQSQRGAKEIAKVFAFRPDETIQQEVIDQITVTEGEAHSVANPINQDEVFKMYHKGNYTSGLVVHTHPDYTPRPSYNDMQAGMKTLMMVPAFMIVGEVVTDIPEDVDDVLNSTLSKSIAVWGMETEDGKTLTADKMNKLFEIVKSRVARDIENVDAIQESWQLTGPFVDELQKLGVNTCYHILGKKRDLFNDIIV